jgi:transcriptional regulator with XRE-family HTH domain
MDDRRLGLAVRARRLQRGWRQSDLAAAAGLSRPLCSLLEHGRAAELTVRSARRIAAAVDLPLEWSVGWQRQEVDRLLDADHSAIAAAFVTDLIGWGWDPRAEVTFNHYGDRGRVDVLAFHPTYRVLLIVEVKTAIVDAQALLGSLDVKRRLAPVLARDAGWTIATAVPALVVLEGTTARRHLARLDPLFSRFSTRGSSARAWLRSPAAPIDGLLLLRQLPNVNGADRRLAGRRRVRVARR